MKLPNMINFIEALQIEQSYRIETNQMSIILFSLFYQHCKCKVQESEL